MKMHLNQMLVFKSKKVRITNIKCETNKSHAHLRVHIQFSRLGDAKT